MEGVQVVGNSQCSVAFREQYSLRCRLNMGSDDDAVTNSGRLFHTRAAATGKARSPTVYNHEGGTVQSYGTMFTEQSIKIYRLTNHD